eukprot:TRINITY_DN143_c1_g1_i5.p1 TRINITY_DN143_c1_g1~~TRINITY_DN143_c1_g1_i5.p1  ORF type:complete len:216 (-),score=46.91 TRINITY_DN143_c1_g1_i5:101-748(-)
MMAVGFDYDYTLANYTPEIQPLIYKMAQEYMISNMRYPEELKEFHYDPSFAIRGLTYDTKRGYLVKMDYLHNVQPDAAYCGRRPLTQSQIVSTYGSFHISMKHFPNLRPMIDNFSLPEICLISDTIEYFHNNNMSFDPAYVYADVTKAITHIHTSYKLHQEVLKDLPLYLPSSRPKITEFLQRMKKQGIKVSIHHHNNNNKQQQPKQQHCLRHFL